MPQLGPDFDLATRLKRVEDWIARQSQNPFGQAFSATQSDGSVGMSVLQNLSGSGSTGLRFYQGPLSARDPSSGYHGLLMYVGEIFLGGSPDDSGVLLYRPDGTESMVVGNRGAQIVDPQGNRVFATDEYGSTPSDRGIDTPWIPLGQPVTSSAAGTGWPNTTSASMSAISFLTFPAQHARLTWYGTSYAPAGSFGNVQVTVNNGATGLSWGVAPGFTNFNETIDLGTWTWHEVLQLAVNAELTSGVGPIYMQVYGVWGCGSLS